MSTRLQRVEEMLRRAVAEVLLFDGLRDPRLQPVSAISVTGVKVSADLSSARVYVDVSKADADVETVLAGLKAGAGTVRRHLGGRIHLKRTPRLTFVSDESIERGTAVERILDEIRTQSPDGDGGGEDSDLDDDGPWDDDPADDGED